MPLAAAGAVIPGFESMSDTDRVIALRRWAARNIILASTSACLLPGIDPTLEAVFPRFRARQGGFWCGGTSELLRRIYVSAVYEARNYNYGLLNSKGEGLTHVTTLVQVDNVWIQQDAYLPHDHGIVPFVEVLRGLERRTITPAREDVAHRICLFDDPSDDDPGMRFWVLPADLPSALTASPFSLDDIVIGHAGMGASLNWQKSKYIDPEN